MQSENRLFDDFAKLMNGLAGTVAGMSREAQNAFREKNREWIAGMDFVSRDEFEAVKAMAAAARDEVDALRAQLDRLEGAGAPPVAPKAPRAPQAPTAPEPPTPVGDS